MIFTMHLQPLPSSMSEHVKHVPFADMMYYT